MTLKVADGYNNIAGLVALEPQGRTPGVMPGRFIMGGDKHIYEDGFPSLDIVYESLTPEQFNNLLAQNGLTGTARSNEVTVEAPRNHDRQVSNWNAIVRYPEIPRDGRYERFFWRNVVFHYYAMVGLDEGAYY